MKIKEGFILKDVAGSKIVIATGEERFNFNGVMTFNEVGAFIFNLLDGTNTPADIVEKISSEYNVDKSTAEKDVSNFIEKLRAHNLLDE